MTRDLLLDRWTDTGTKLVVLAEEFPEALYDFRPAPEVRTFADQLRHVAFWNRYAAESLRGEHPDGEANTLAEREYPHKPEIASAVRDSVDRMRDAIASTGEQPDTAAADTVVSYIGHGAEHYGQLVLYYRLNGLVPPASRGQ